MMKPMLTAFCLALFAALAFAATEMVRSDHVSVSEAKVGHSLKKGVSHATQTLNVSVDLSNAKAFTAAKDCKVTFTAVHVNGEEFSKALPSRTINCSGFGSRWNFQVPATDIWSNEGDVMGKKCKGLSAKNGNTSVMRKIAVDYEVIGGGNSFKGSTVALAKAFVGCSL